MSLSDEKARLKSQIIDTEYQLSLMEGNLLMSLSLAKRLENLKNDLDSLPTELKEAKVRLLFSGNAVSGSEGIKAGFISDTIKPFQELVKTQTALNRFGRVGKRGKSRSSESSELFITGLPRGSFGVELSQLTSRDFFAEEDVAKAIEQVIELVEASAKNDQTFDSLLEKTPARNLSNLKTFLKKIDEEKSILKMESGSKFINVSREAIHQAYARVNSATKEDTEFFENGILRGVFLESSKFEFTNDDGYKYNGIISGKVSEDLLNVYWNGRCLAHMKKSKIRFISGKDKVTYELIGISEPKEKDEAPN